MKRRVLAVILTFLIFCRTNLLGGAESPTDRSTLHKDQRIGDFNVANLYSDSDGTAVGAKFWHVPSGMPIFLLQIETVPQVYTWVDTPVDSDRGLPHALEHLLEEKGTKGRYLSLLSDMRLSQSVAATWRDFNLYSFTSGSGMDGFFEVFHAWLDALYHPDFTDAEAEREFYHFAVVTNAARQMKTLTERGTVYNEKQSGQGEENCYHDLDKRILGNQNPLAANIGGDPDQMRGVTPQEIREFHRKHYRLGPNVGFIFVINPKENVRAFLERVSREFESLPSTKRVAIATGARPGDPKYAIHPSADLEPRICPVPGANEAAPADIWFGWKPKEVQSMMSLRMLDLFYSGLADGQRSLLHKALVDSKTRIADTGATSIGLDSARSESPRYLLWKIQISGIPGNRLSAEKITEIRNVILAKVREISEYPDRSPALTAFNGLIASYAQAERRSKRVWRNNPPLFGVQLDADWKDFLEYLEMDSSFVRSLSQDEIWKQIDENLKSGKNIWRDLIQEFSLLDTPYSEATPSSPQLLKRLETEKQERINNRLKSLKEKYRVGSDQEAVARFDRDELSKTKEIDQIESKISRPHFTDHPPLVPDEDMRYTQFRIDGVPALASLFERPPSLEIGLSFDLRQIPQKYYKYLPLLARSFDSLGLKEDGQITDYEEMSAATRSRFVEFGTGTSYNGFSKRADLTFRAAATSVPELREALTWMRRSLLSSYLEPANLTRLRDIVAEQISVDTSYTKQDEFSWVWTPAQVFHYQSDAAYLGLASQFTKAHWDGRLYWLLHEPVSGQEINRLASFSSSALASLNGASRTELGQRLNALNAQGIEAELVEHWRRNLDSFPEDKLQSGLKSLADEVLSDLRSGPISTILELRHLQELVVNRRALYLDLLVSPKALDALRPELATFVAAIPNRDLQNEDSSNAKISSHPIIDKLQNENDLGGARFPWYLGFVNPESITGNAIFYSDFIDYSQTDRDALMKLLSSAILSGRGPRSLYMKAHQAGSAYALLMRGDPSRGLILYYADRSTDLSSLIAELNSAVEEIERTQDPYVVDYALRQVFSLPRSIYTFSIRENAFAQEMRDGNTPEKVRQFNEALLRLRRDADLRLELTRRVRDSLCGILLREECTPQQTAHHSLFFFVASERILSDTEKHLPGIKLLRVWPSDYWLP